MLRHIGSNSRQLYWKRSVRSYASVAGLPSVGEKLHGFTCNDVKTIPELELTAVKLSHDRTAAEHLHIARDDQNNVFSIGFKTNPPDDTGVPHILEHTTLCGSSKYRVRDPFFKMLNRSLSNFMNAMTASDYTYYPFASTNPSDISNLRDIYLDSTLSPLLRQLDFKQEGWRLEHENPSDSKTPITFKGVVYNEMKGMMSDASYLFYNRFQKEVYPSLNDSGGNPSKMTDLTYQQLKEFHTKNYHPSNAKIFTYGNMPVSDHLQHLNSKFEPFSMGHKDAESKQISDFSKSREVNLTGPIDPLNDASKQVKTSLSFKMNETNDVFTGFSLRVLSSLLLEGHASPLYQALIDTHLGSEFSPNTGYDTSGRTAVFSVGLQGIADANVEKVQQTILTVLKDTFTKGFEQDRIDAVLHQLELGLKHKSSRFGMSLLSSLNSGWFNQVDPLEMLSWNETLNRFRQELSKGRYLESLIEKYLLDKPSLAFTMRPAETFFKEIEAEETSRLKTRIESLSSEDKRMIDEQGKALLKNQEETEDLSSLPTLSIQDIPRQGVHKALEKTTVQNVPLQRMLGATNGITYFRAVSLFDGLPDDLKSYVPLFCDAVMNLGTKTRSMGEIESDIKRKTGGLTLQNHISTNHSDLNAFEDGLVVSGYALDQNVPAMFDLLRILLLETNFDNVAKLKSVFKGNASGAVDGIAENGHAFARNFAASKLTPAANASEITGGMTQVKLVSQLANHQNFDEVIEKLKLIQNHCFSTTSLRTSLTCGNEAAADSTAALEGFVKNLPNRPRSNPQMGEFAVQLPSKVFIPLPFQVNYAGYCVTGVPYSHQDGASIQVLANLLTHKYLHREIREKGGAYGGGASYNGASGIFGIYSYRDPNTARTIDTMQSAGDWASNNRWTGQDLQEAKLSVFQGVDAPISISHEGMIEFMDGITPDMRQQRREQLLDVTAEDVKQAALTYLVNPIKRGQVSLALLGEKKEWMSAQNGWALHEWGPVLEQETLPEPEQAASAL